MKFFLHGWFSQSLFKVDIESQCSELIFELKLYFHSVFLNSAFKLNFWLDFQSQVLNSIFKVDMWSWFSKLISKLYIQVTIRNWFSDWFFISIFYFIFINFWSQFLTWMSIFKLDFWNLIKKIHIQGWLRSSWSFDIDIQGWYAKSIFKVDFKDIH